MSISEPQAQDVRINRKHGIGKIERAREWDCMVRFSPRSECVSDYRRGLRCSWPAFLNARHWLMAPPGSFDITPDPRRPVRLGLGVPKMVFITNDLLAVVECHGVTWPTMHNRISVGYVAEFTRFIEYYIAAGQITHRLKRTARGHDRRGDVQCLAGSPMNNCHHGARLVVHERHLPRARRKRQGDIFDCHSVGFGPSHR